MINVVYVILVTWYFARIDAKHILKGEYIKEKSDRLILRAVVMIFPAVFQDSWAVLFGNGFLFTALFDQMLNILRGLPLFSLGSDEPEHEPWDDFWRKNEFLYVSFKGSALITGLVCLLLI